MELWGLIFKISNTELSYIQQSPFWAYMQKNESRNSNTDVYTHYAKGSKAVTKDKHFMIPFTWSTQSAQVQVYGDRE